jgi:hypothetical protein
MNKIELHPKIHDKKTVMKNVRESRLDYMFHRMLISEPEFVAGSRYRRLCEISQLGGRAATYEPRLDYNSNNVMDSKLGAFFVLNKISEDIPEYLIRVLKYFCYQNYGIKEICNLIGKNERTTSNMLHEGLFRLCIFFGYKKSSNTIRGQGAKKRWQSKQYLKYVASHPCLLCQHNETQAHHITIAEKRGISQKVSDYYTLPLCYLHHDQLHNTGERKFWKILDLNPVDLAKYFFDLWEKGNKDKESIHTTRGL